MGNFPFGPWVGVISAWLLYANLVTSEQQATTTRKEPTTMDVTEFAEANNITATVKPDPSKPTRVGGDRYFKVTLRFDGRQMTVPFFQGSAWTTDPTAADVLNCLALDSSGYENASDFEDWCAEYGFDLNDPDVRAANARTYYTVKSQSEKLCAFLGFVLYTELLWGD